MALIYYKLSMIYIYKKQLIAEDNKITYFVIKHLLRANRYGQAYAVPYHFVILLNYLLFFRNVIHCVFNFLSK